MSKPVRIRVRCVKEVRERWMEVKGQFDLTHAELAHEMAEFVLAREQEFRKHLQSETREAVDDNR